MAEPQPGQCLAGGTGLRSALENRTDPIYTLDEHVRNIIIDVTDSKIIRRSDRGRGDEHTPVPGGQITRIWQSLAETGQAPVRRGSPLRFDTRW